MVDGQVFDELHKGKMITDRIDNITHIPPEYLHTVLPAPKSVKIELSPRCNYRCGFCALRQREKQPKEDMDFDLFRKITIDMKNAGVEEVGCFFLGESFMNPYLLVDAITHLKDIGIPYVFLTSNASIATPEHVDACMEAGLDSLKWSVNAASPEQFADIMCVNPRWYEMALKNIKAAWEVRERGGYNTGLYASSIHYDGKQHDLMQEIIDSRVRSYVDEHYWLPLYGQAGLTAGEKGTVPVAGNPGRYENLRAPLPCWSVFTEGHITYDSRLSACCFDHDGRFHMGDLTTTPFMEAWNSQEFQNLRQAHLTEDVTGTACEDCVAYQ